MIFCVLESDSEVPEAIASLALAKEKLKKEKEKEQLLKDTLLEMETALNEESHRSSTRFVLLLVSLSFSFATGTIKYC